MNMKLIASLLLSLLATAAIGKGVTPPTPPATDGMVPWGTAQRALTFSESRHWQTTTGVILVCPWEYEASHNKKCHDKGNDKTYRWIPLEQYTIQGFEIVGFQYRHSNVYSDQHLFVYFGSVKPAVQEPPPAPEPVTIKINSLNVTTDKVYIRRKK